MNLTTRELQSSPRPWGCFRHQHQRRPVGMVFPTPVGVFLAADVKSVCGRWSSPRPWGCFCPAIAWPCATWVFPTPVGVFLAVAGLDEAGVCLPHARGGVSGHVDVDAAIGASSPRPWGCFPFSYSAKSASTVFPTPVGVFPKEHSWFRAKDCLPHARGGVSKSREEALKIAQSSPRPWGCFRHQVRHAPGEEVFPTPVGVFPPSRAMLELMACLPHARGGVSDELARAKIEARSSPRPWGCFLPRVHTSTGSAVFPTPVGVFPRSCRGCRCHGGLPHARGGVSSSTKAIAAHLGSSPRPWGCFLAGSAA